MKAPALVVELMGHGGLLMRIEVESTWPGGAWIVPVPKLGPGVSLALSRGEIPTYELHEN